MKRPLLTAYLVMLPRLRAEEALEAVQTAAAGAGVMEQKDQQRLIDELERTAAGREHRRARMSRDQQRIMLATAGIRAMTEDEWQKLSERQSSN